MSRYRRRGFSLTVSLDYKTFLSKALVLLLSAQL